MSFPVFPLLASTVQRIGLPYKKSSEWNTVITKSANFHETRIPNVQYPKWHFSLNYALATGRVDDVTSAISTTIGFYFAMQGSAGTFLWNDLQDNTVTNATFGTGDGSSTAFQLIRPLGPVVNGVQPSDIVQAVNGTPTIKVNGVTKTAGTDYSISSLGIVTFTTAPALNASLTWSGSFYFVCRFSDDQWSDMSQFAPNFWEIPTLNFETFFAG